MLLLTEFASGVIRTFEDPWGPLRGISPKLEDLVYSGQFSIQLLTSFGSLSDLNVRETQGSDYWDLAKTHRFSPFWPVLYAITHRFWVPR